MSKQKQKGTAAETAVVRYMKQFGWDDLVEDLPLSFFPSSCLPLEIFPPFLFLD